MANQEGVDIIIKATDQYTKTINNIAASNKLFGNSIENTQKQIAALEKYMIALVANGISPTSASINVLQTDLKLLNQTINASGTSLKNSNKQWSALALVVQDLPYGFRGIQNNLPALFGSLATGAGAAYFAFSAVVAAVTAWDMGLFKVFETTKKATDAQEDYTKALNSAVASGYGEISQVNALISVVNNQTISIDKRKDALKKLQDEYPGYFKNMSIEKTSVDDLSISVGELTKAIIARAEATAMTSEIEKIAAQRYGNTKAIEKNEMAITNLKNSLVILSKESGYVSGGFGADAKKLTSPYTQALIEIQKLEQANQKLETSNESLQNSMSLLQNSVNFRAGISSGLNTNAPNAAKDKKNTVSKYDEQLAQEEFNFYKDSIFQAQEYYNKLNNIQKINALMEATIKGATTDELLTIQQTYEQKSINFEKEYQSKLFEYLHQGQQLNKKLTDNYNKEKLEGQVTYTDNYIKSLDAQLRAELRLHKGNVNLQQEDIKNKINQLKFAQVFAAGNVKATEDINAALLRLNSTLTGVGTNWANTANRIVSIANDFLANSFVSLGETIGQALAGEKVQPFVALAEILASSLIELGKALISFAILEGAAFEALKDPTKWPIALAAGVAAVAAGSFLKAKLGKDKTKKFANGGIISGPTMGLMGEYPGASSNPEVVAPLDKLKDMIGGGGGGTFVLKGQDLLLSVNRAQKASNLKGQNINLA